LNKNICIHAHFYQPPRENAWLEEVEPQDSAYPYHDWNQKIAAECYGPNAKSRILDSEKKIVDIVNNYSKISFNFGPTLLSWLKRKEPEIYASIIEADRVSRGNFSGHGSAIAQCYNHMVMPLANIRDKRTQVLWGIRDFESHFGRRPEGMWLPETAVDTETLDIMSEQGIKFTILAPSQAAGFRRIGDHDWKEVNGAKIDPKIPYLFLLPSGRSIAVFFYDGPISHDIAFGDLLKNGENFAKRLRGAFVNSEEAQLVHIASDGETYGHHHRFGDMALGFCLHYIESNKLANITIYGEFLEKFPPKHEVRIFENSSWSCIHGVERWRNNCGCNSGAHPKWNQAWRAPLRYALDRLRDDLLSVYEKEMALYADDPVMVRNEYIKVILDRSKENVEKFLSVHVKNELSHEDKVKFLKLLEMQRYAMLMYTSCGWFFDEISGIETVQILQYAARAIQLADGVGNIALRDIFLGLLEKAPSNIPGLKNGANVYKTFVSPSVLDIARVGGHYAISSLFEQYPETIKIYSFTAQSQMYDRIGVGKQKLAIGKAHIFSDITWEEDIISFVVLHLGDHNIVGGVRQYADEDTFIRMYQKIRDMFIKSDISGTIRLIEKHFIEHHCSLWHLFRDEQRKILNQILDSALKEVDASLHQINERHYPIIQALRQLHVPLPKVFWVTVELMLNTDLIHTLEKEELDMDRLKRLVDEAKKWGLELDKTTLGFVAANKVNTLMGRFAGNPGDSSLTGEIVEIFKTLKPLELVINFWKAQNIFFSIGKEMYPGMEDRSSKGDKAAGQWITNFDELSNYLRIKIS
jgi:alpha-amylase/alpha-mannosidase (GH57 family)